MLVLAPSMPALSVTPATSARDTTQPASALPTAGNSVVTPINIPLLSSLLSLHPSPSLVDYIIAGLTFGFSIGFTGTLHSSSSKNLLSSYEHFEAVSTAIELEVSRGHTAGPFSSPPLDNFHCSPIGAVRKNDGTVRLILDLSSPRGSAVNEGINPEEFSVKYCSFDDAVTLVIQNGPSSYMAKADIKHAFRLCPISPDEWHLLGYQWNNQFYFDTRLPFGSRSSPFIFNCFADLLCWILKVVMTIACIIHYLDDFFLCHSSYDKCLKDRDILIQTFSDLNIPLARDKLVGPSTVITFLGIEINSINKTIRLPPDKFSELLEKVKLWKAKKKCTKRELLSLIGSLSFACKVVKSGRLFLRRLIELSTSVSRLNHHISLNHEAVADVHWWLEFVPSWHGVEFIQSPLVSNVDIALATDASSLGIGANFGNHWFSCPLSKFAGLSCLQKGEDDPFDINLWELFALVAAVFTWGKAWSNKQIIIYVDNLSITFVWLRGSKDKNLMHLVRHLFLFTAKHNINILLQHIPGHPIILLMLCLVYRSTNSVP
jgi:hypothetical protein